LGPIIFYIEAVEAPGVDGLVVASSITSIEELAVLVHDQPLPYHICPIVKRKIQIAM
jgi:hypothetical protein